MSDIQAMVQQLIDSGTPPALAAEIVAQAFVAGAKSAPARKASREAAYTPDFDQWWSSYPRTPTMSKKEAYAAWLKLKPEQREAAKSVLPAFKAWLSHHLSKHPDYSTLHACRFLSQRRFEGFIVGKVVDPGIYIKQDAPGWDVMAERYQQVHQKSPPTDRNGGWYFPREWMNGSTSAHE